MKYLIIISIALQGLTSFANPSPVPLLPIPIPAPSFATPLLANQAKTLAEIQNNMQAAVTCVAGPLSRNFQEIWHNPHGLSPQNSFNSLQATAWSFYQIWLSNKASINTVAPNTITLTPPQIVTSNGDGTVTVQPSPSPSP